MAPYDLFAALRGGFPARLDDVAIETLDGPKGPLYYTWRDLDRASARIANLLDALDIEADARIAVHTEKSVEALMLYLGVLRSGRVYLPLNTAYQASEMAYFIDNAQPQVVVCCGRDHSWLSKIAFRSGTPYVFTLNEDITGTLLDRAAAYPDTHTPARRQSDDLAAILYTSGTTGRSKGAMLTHGNLLSNAQVLQRYWGWQPSDVLIHALPIFHVHGLFVAIHGALINGSRMLWLSKFDSHTVISRLSEATVFMGVPTLYVRMLADSTLTRQACGHMRLFISGSAPLLKETHQAWEQRTGHVILERYGMSETVMLTSNPYFPTDGQRVAGTVGFALPGVEVRIRDAQGHDLERGDIGGIEVRGPNIFKGYWNMPEKTAEDFTADGWFKTGDVGQMDSHGRLTIVGRSKDLIISGGYNVYPAEVESFLNEMPGVAESAVVGVAHPDFGEAVVAVVIPKPAAHLESASMIEALKSKIARFKVPKQLFVLEDLPRNAMGKVQKNVLRDRYKGLFAA